MPSGLHSTGSISIPDLRRKVAGLGEGPFRAELSAALSAAAFKLTMDTFKTSTDPYGKPWAPLKRRKGQPLLDTGRMRASIFFNPMADGFRVDFSVPYAAHHQYGTKPHQRAARTARQNARGRFVGKRARTAFLIRLRAHTNPGIPQRQMIPMEETGGLPPTWLAKFNTEADALVRRHMRAA